MSISNFESFDPVDRYVNEGINLKAAHLSSEDYQKAKKLKAFNSTDWVWNPKSNLYDKVSESVHEAEEHEFNPNETAERLKRREQQNIERYRAAQEREDAYGITYYKYRIAIDKIDLQKLKLMTQIHLLKQKYKK